MASSYTTSKHLEKPANGDDVDVWDVPLNGNSDALDAIFGSVSSINATAASGTVALTFSQYRPMQISVTGTLSANVTYQFPASVGGQWTVINSTSGAFTLTFSSAGGGTSVTVGQGKRVNIACDATNVFTTAAASGANTDITSLSGLTTPLTVPQGGTGAATLTGVLKGNGAGAFTAATAGTDYVKPDTASTITGTQTFAGTSSTLAEILSNAAEIATVSATAATGVVAYYTASQSVLYFTSNAAANWTVNLTLSAGTTLNTALATGQCVTVAFLVTQGATPYYNSAVQVDGTAVGVTTKWQGGAPTSGSANGVDVYTYAIVKTGSATFTVFASRTAFS